MRKCKVVAQKSRRFCHKVAVWLRKWQALSRITCSQLTKWFLRSSSVFSFKIIIIFMFMYLIFENYSLPILYLEIVVTQKNDFKYAHTYMKPRMKCTLIILLIYLNYPWVIWNNKLQWDWPDWCSTMATQYILLIVLTTIIY